MSTVILLTAADADKVRGVSAETPLAALDPARLTDGRFFLGVEVLSDPAHAEDRDFLSTLPRVDYASIASLIPQVSR
jgi:hypothetical protein